MSAVLQKLFLSKVHFTRFIIRDRIQDRILFIILRNTENIWIILEL